MSLRRSQSHHYHHHHHHRSSSSKNLQMSSKSINNNIDSKNVRRENSFYIRQSAAKLAAIRPHDDHQSNHDEQRFGPSQFYPVSFSKGLPHDMETGLLVHPSHYQQFVCACLTGLEVDANKIPLGPPKTSSSRLFQSSLTRHPTVSSIRPLENISAGFTFDLEGPDAQVYTMPPAPDIQSSEMCMEMNELYWMSLLRDVPFVHFKNAKVVRRAITSMNDQTWVKLNIKRINSIQEEQEEQRRHHAYNQCYSNNYLYQSSSSLTSVRRRKSMGSGSSRCLQRSNSSRHHRKEWDHLSPEERQRMRGPFNTQTIFRGILPGDDKGPYISQFLLIGTKGVAKDMDVKQGIVQYGATRIDQRVRVASEGVDYLTTWESFVDVQNGANVGHRNLFINSGRHNGSGHLRRTQSEHSHSQSYKTYIDDDIDDDNNVEYRFITTPRDLMTYVHYDASFQAYHTACLILLDMKVPFDPGFPFQDTNVQRGFVSFGGPHVLSLVAEVATRALKAVWYQKFQVHRRIRPEAVGGLLERFRHANNRDERQLYECVQRMYCGLDTKLLDRVASANRYMNKRIRYRKDDYDPSGCHNKSSVLLSCGYAEGSPMHPAYGSGHATIAGACVTILKAMFDTQWTFKRIYVANRNGTALKSYKNDDDEDDDNEEEGITVEDELNKLCSNISIGRNWAGIHYFSDYYEAILLGEKIALRLLEEQALTHTKESYTLSVPLFDGSIREINNRKLQQQQQQRK